MTSVPLSIDTCLQFACDSADKPCSKKTQNTSSSQNVMALLFSVSHLWQITMTLSGPLKTFPSYEIRAATISLHKLWPAATISINFIHSWKAHLNISLLQGLYLPIKYAASPGVPKLLNTTDCKRSTLQMNFSHKMLKWEKLRTTMCTFVLLTDVWLLKNIFVGIRI